MTKPPANDTTARRLFSQRMRAAGWERMPPPGFAWEHTETGTTWEGLNWTADRGIDWVWYFERGETPPKRPASAQMPCRQIPQGF